MGAPKLKTRVGDLLIAAGLVTQPQVDEAVRIASIMRVQLGRVFVEFADQNPQIPKLTEHQVEAAIASQDHIRSGGRPIVQKDAAIRALEVAKKADDAHAAERIASAETARKITVNTDLDPIDASQRVGDE